MAEYEYQTMAYQDLTDLVIDQSEETADREAAFQELLDREVGVERIDTADLKALVEEQEVADRFLRIVENALNHR